MMDEELICRTCLCRISTNKSLSVFLQSNIWGRSTTIAELIVACAPVTISQEDGLPTVICNDCFRQLQLSFHFKLHTLKANSILRDVMKKNFGTDLQQISQNCTEFLSLSGIYDLNKQHIYSVEEILQSVNSDKAFSIDLNNEDHLCNSKNEIMVEQENTIANNINPLTGGVQCSYTDTKNPVTIENMNVNLSKTAKSIKEESTQTEMIEFYSDDIQNISKTFNKLTNKPNSITIYPQVPNFINIAADAKPKKIFDLHILKCESIIGSNKIIISHDTVELLNHIVQKNETNDLPRGIVFENQLLQYIPCLLSEVKTDYIFRYEFKKKNSMTEKVTSKSTTLDINNINSQIYKNNLENKKQNNFPLTIIKKKCTPILPKTNENRNVNQTVTSSNDICIENNDEVITSEKNSVNSKNSEEISAYLISRIENKNTLNKQVPSLLPNDIQNIPSTSKCINDFVLNNSFYINNPNTFSYKNSEKLITSGDRSTINISSNLVKSNINSIKSVMTQTVQDYSSQIQKNIDVRSNSNSELRIQGNESNNISNEAQKKEKHVKLLSQNPRTLTTNMVSNDSKVVTNALISPSLESPNINSVSNMSIDPQNVNFDNVILIDNSSNDSITNSNTIDVKTTDKNVQLTKIDKRSTEINKTNKKIQQQKRPGAISETDDIPMKVTKVRLNILKTYLRKKASSAYISKPKFVETPVKILPKFDESNGTVYRIYSITSPEKQENFKQMSNVDVIQQKKADILPSGSQMNNIDKESQENTSKRTGIEINLQQNTIKKQNTTNDYDTSQILNHTIIPAGAAELYEDCIIIDG